MTCVKQSKNTNPGASGLFPRIYLVCETAILLSSCKPGTNHYQCLGGIHIILPSLKPCLRFLNDSKHRAGALLVQLPKERQFEKSFLWCLFPPAKIYSYPCYASSAQV